MDVGGRLASLARFALVLVSACASFSPADDVPDAGADSGAPVFADDFERNELQGTWTSLGAPSGGNAIAIDGAQHEHGGKSLHATVSAMKGIAYLERRDAFHAVTRIELAVRADALPDTGFVLAKVLYDNDTEVNLSLAPHGIKVAEQKGMDADHYAEASPSAFPLNEWVSLVWTIDYAAKLKKYGLIVIPNAALAAIVAGKSDWPAN